MSLNKLSAISSMSNTLLDIMMKNNDSKKYVSRSDYEEFKHHYLFEALRGVPYGKAFCDKFGIRDYILIFSVLGDQALESYIEEIYVRDEA